jgi:methionyl-tRNA formyltransferase
MRIAFAGSPDAALPTLRALADSTEHSLIRIFTQPDRPSGRGRVLTPTSVGRWGEENSCEVVKAHSAQELAPFLSDIDCVVTVGYGLLLPQNILDLPTHGFINLHFSLLPKWRGAAPVQRAIEAQDRISGITVFHLDAGMDTGPYYLIQRYALDGDITADELLAELALLGPEAVSETLSMIERGVRPTPQSVQEVSYASKLSKEQGAINWNLDAERVSAHIRAFTSNPGAWTLFRGSLIKIDKIALTQHVLAPGELSVSKNSVIVGTTSGSIELIRVTPQGKASMDAASWARGARIEAGDRLGS